MRIALFLAVGLAVGLALSTYRIGGTQAREAGQKRSSRQDKLESFAKCLSEKGYQMYGSFTCSHCRVQRKNFGKAFKYIKEIECNPNAPDTQVDLCLAKNIRKTPTWIQEVDGKEVNRLEGYQLLETLASSSGCEY